MLRATKRLRGLNAPQSELRRQPCGIMGLANMLCLGPSEDTNPSVGLKRKKKTRKKMRKKKGKKGKREKGKKEKGKRKRNKKEKEQKGKETKRKRNKKEKK